MDLGSGKRRAQIDIKKFTGLFDFQILGINPPTKEDIEKITGRLPEKDPEYTGIHKLKLGENSEQEVEFFKFTFYLKATFEFEGKEESFIIPHNIRISKLDKLSKAGKNQLVNQYGVTSYPSKETGNYPDWFLKIDNRNALVNEDLLYKLFIPYANLDTKQYPDIKVWFSPEDLMSGKAADFLHREVVHKAAKYDDGTPWKVRGLVGINDNGYMTLYKEFLIEGSVPSDKSKWRKELRGEHGFKANYQNSLAIKKFEPSTDMGGAATPNGGDAMDAPAGAAVNNDAAGGW